MAFQVVANRPSPFRLQLVLVDLFGPLTSYMLGRFDPRRDVAIYNGGKQLGADSFTWDPTRNRYLVFLKSPLDFDQIIQVIHHVPDPPFEEEEDNPNISMLTPGHDPDILADPDPTGGG